MSKLPKNPVKGKVYQTKNPKTGRMTCFKATGKIGFGKFRIVKCGESSLSTNPRVPAGSNFLPGIGWYD